MAARRGRAPRFPLATASSCRLQRREHELEEGYFLIRDQHSILFTEGRAANGDARLGSARSQCGGHNTNHERRRLYVLQGTLKCEWLV